MSGEIIIPEELRRKIVGTINSSFSIEALNYKKHSNYQYLTKEDLSARLEEVSINDVISLGYLVYQGIVIYDFEF